MIGLLLAAFAIGMALGYLLTQIQQPRRYILMPVIRVPADAELKLNFNGEVFDAKGNKIENAEVVVNTVEVETFEGNWGTVAEDSDEPGEWDLRFQDAGATSTLKATGTVNGFPATGRLELAVDAGAPARASISMDMTVDAD